MGQRHVDDGGVQNFHKHRRATTIATAHGICWRVSSCRGCDPSFHRHLRCKRQPQRQRFCFDPAPSIAILTARAAIILTVVNGGIFCREGGEARAAALLDTVYLRGPSSSISGHASTDTVDLIARLHAFKLRLFKSSRPPNNVRGNQENSAVSACTSDAGLHVAFGDKTRRKGARTSV